MQGIGVSTPSAAAVAAATVGLLAEEHIPNGITFFIGMLSMIVAAGTGPPVTLPSGVTTSDAGASPKLQVSMAPMVTIGGMGAPPGSLAGSLARVAAGSCAARRVVVGVDVTGATVVGHRGERLEPGDVCGPRDERTRHPLLAREDQHADRVPVVIGVPAIEGRQEVADEDPVIQGQVEPRFER